jgi:hypothetical protein
MGYFFCLYTSLYQMSPLSCPWQRPVSLDVPAMQTVCRIQLPCLGNSWKKNPMWPLLLLYRLTTYFKPLPLYQGDNWTGIMLIRLTSISASIGFFSLSLPIIVPFISRFPPFYMCAYIYVPNWFLITQALSSCSYKISIFHSAHLGVFHLYISYGHNSFCYAVYSRLSATFFAVTSQGRIPAISTDWHCSKHTSTAEYT